ncbi:MAG: LysM peptidoglycan-binding domain-containing protein, partial [Deltaproteobacteria bacterium]|nr:LysM peptidoglycan-binding domain-containing protein [Deltaproteobacteria bacterium]
MKHVIKFRLMIFLSTFFLLLFTFCTYSVAEEKMDNVPEEKQETIKKAKDDINKYIVESETGVYYVVQKGDTLWDLSRQFSDSPWV